MQNVPECAIQVLSEYENVREIYLFGSVARDEYDEKSDIDILIIIDNCIEEEYIEYKKEFSRILQMPVSWISLYRIDKVIKMWECGSYFLWHIKEEGKVLYSQNKQLEILLESLPKYKNIEMDINEYECILSDIEKEIHCKDIYIEYELSVLASLVRNTCIAISYLDNRLDFGRKSAVLYCKEKYNLGFSMSEYEDLYQYRLFFSRKIKQFKKGELSNLTKWVIIERNLLEIAREKEDVKDEK